MSKKVSQFTDLTSVDLSNNDIIPILDISESIPANRNKKISVLDLHASLAPKVNPTFTGTVVVPTPPVNNSSTLAATTQYVQLELQDLSLDDLTNVSGATSNTVNNKVLTYNSTNSQYEPKFATTVKTLTLTTNNTNISANENTYLFLDPNGANRTVILPLGQEGLRYIISNLNTNFTITVSASNPNLIDLSLYDGGGVGPTTVSSYALDQVSELVFSNSKWFFISQTYSTGGSSGVTTFDALTDVNIGTPGTPENGRFVGWDNATSQFTLKERPGTATGDLVKLQNVSGNPGLPAVDGSLLTNLPTGLVSPLTSNGDILTHNGTTHQRQALGQQGQRLSVNIESPNSLRWEQKWSAEDILYSKEFPRSAVGSENINSYEIIKYIGTNELPLGTYTNVANSGKVIVTTNTTAGSGLNDPTVLTDGSTATSFSLNNSEFVKWQFVDYKIQPYMVLIHDTSNVVGDTILNIEVSNDNTNWTLIGTINLLGPTTSLPWSFTFTNISAFYSYLRLTRNNGSSTGSNNFSEIKLYGYVKNNTSQGHVFAYDATRQKLVPIKASANNLVLTSDSAEDSGVKWVAPGSSTASNKIPTNEQTLSANKTLLNTDVSIQVLDPGGANRDVVLPVSPQTDLYFKIINTDPANFSINIKETAGGSAVIILNGSTPFVECHRTATQWIILS